MDPEAFKRRGWREQRILVVAESDKRLDFLERELVRRIGERLYGEGGSAMTGSADAWIRNASRPGDVVLDAFGGFGTTLIAAEKAARAACLIELDPKYVDVIARRWQDWTGELATRESDGAAYDELSVTGESAGKGFTLKSA